MKKERIEVYYTDLEWSIAEEKAKNNGAKSLRHYLTKKLAELDKSKVVCTNEMLSPKIKSKRRKYYPSNPSWEILVKISQEIGVSPSIIVSRLFINPLLENTN